ncbi:acyltransferase family protein [Cedecea neteri]|uniref:acyltransferase family protein n=1 Tax=Cedecea neteri TaxID=158822 RepID=UPI002893130A|nr:acyltransferase family protein [Cedecea neteri]WNJ80621.1 acyltransferase family protein [Cedecea neteri]
MLKYRKELDGLRCLAVLAVIIYHSGISLFGVKMFKGGFFGVDVFFVLSGYLITDIICNKLDGNSFNIFDFFWRRAKRIFPALIVMLLATSAAAYFILLPNNLIAFSKSLLSAVYFGSNYYFLGEDSYVSSASIFKPLLHTWSLAVEWQFYVIYPFIVVLINRFFKKYMVTVLLSLSITSLLYANYIVPNYPDLAFYTLPARAWELMLGGVMTFFTINKAITDGKDTLSLSIFKIMPTVGFFMVIYAMIFIGSDVKHPSFVTLVPVLGTCFIVAFANKDDVVTSVLSLSPVVFIGAMSYSIYLWHQPIFVFFRFTHHEYISLIDLALLTAITLVLAYASYRFIESPFRGKKVSTISISVAALITIFVSLFAFFSIRHDGLPNRYHGAIKDAYEMYKVPEFRKMVDTEHPGVSLRTDLGTEHCGFRSLENPCRFGDESWITIGDSYAGQYDYELNKKLSRSGHGLVSLAYEQCPFVNDIWFGNVPECLVINQQRWKFIKALNSSKNIFIATNYNFFWQGKEAIDNPVEMGKKDFSGGVPVTEDKVWKSFAENVKRLISLGHEVYVVYPTPAPSEDVQSMVFSKLNNKKYTLRKEYTSSSDAYSKAMEETRKLDAYLPDMKGLHKIRPVDALCDGDKCRIIDESGGLYHGAGHLSSSGVKEVISLLDKN